MRTTTIFAETHTSERANHVAYRLVTTIRLTSYLHDEDTVILNYYGKIKTQQTVPDSKIMSSIL